MHAPQTKVLTAAVAADQLFDAVLAIVDKGRYAVVDSDRAARRVAFTSGMTGLSWGHQYQATVAPAGAGCALTLVCGGRDGAPRALLDGWKNSRAADRFLRALQTTSG